MNVIKESFLAKWTKRLIARIKQTAAGFALSKSDIYPRTFYWAVSETITIYLMCLFVESLRVICSFNVAERREHRGLDEFPTRLLLLLQLQEQNPKIQDWRIEGHDSGRAGTDTFRAQETTSESMVVWCLFGHGACWTLTRPAVETSAPYPTNHSNSRQQRFHPAVSPKTSNFNMRKASTICPSPVKAQWTDLSPPTGLNVIRSLWKAQTQRWVWFLISSLIQSLALRICTWDRCFIHNALWCGTSHLNLTCRLSEMHRNIERFQCVRERNNNNNKASAVNKRETELSGCQ